MKLGDMKSLCLKVYDMKVCKLEVCDAKLGAMKSLCFEVHVMKFCAMKIF